MSLSYEARDLALLLADQVEQVVEALSIDVSRRTRRHLIAFAPWSGHHNPKLEIELYPIPGKWNDWVGGKYGDVFDLVACTLGGGERDRKAAYRWALEHLGLSGTRDEAAWERRRAEAAARAAERQKKAAEELARSRRAAKAQWLSGAPLEPRTHGWKYLEARGVDLGELPRGEKGELLVRAVRYSPRETWYGEDGRPGHVGPALLSAMTLRNGDFAAVHKIWIDPDRPGEKADLDPPRKMWPDAMGAAIRLWRGDSRLTERQAEACGLRERVVIAEGVEDGLSIALMAPERRVVAAGSLPGLTAYEPPACADELVIAADNDWGKPQAQALLEAACARLAGEFGVAVFVARSPEGKDFNDLLRGRVA